MASQIMLSPFNIVVLIEQKFLIYIPFRGKEKICWECGGERSLLLEYSISGLWLDLQEVCESPISRIQAIRVTNATETIVSDIIQQQKETQKN